MKEQTVCFTGHRKIPLEEYKIISQRLEKEIIVSINNGYRFFGAGGALGFDTLAARTVLKLKRVYPNIRLILLLPCKNQTLGWRYEDVQEYERIKSLADKVVYVSNNYYKGCMQKRNRYLVNNSSLCICYLYDSTGGTFYTTEYAKKKGLIVINVAEKASILKK